MQEQLLACADQLSDALPAETSTFAAGGPITTVLQLISAIRAQDYKTAFSLAVDLLVMARDAIVGDGDEVINFGAGPGGIDWGTLLSILSTVIGLLAKK